jgi:hypothetical protein
LRAVDFSRPEAAYQVGFFQTPGYARGVAVSGNFAYVADESGLGIYDCRQAVAAAALQIPLPSDPTLFPAYPNPFNGRTKISYHLPQSARLSLDVFDVLGRRAAALDHGFVPAGTYQASFSADNFASGLYIVCLSADGRRQQQKIWLLK